MSLTHMYCWLDECSKCVILECTWLTRMLLHTIPSQCIDVGCVWWKSYTHSWLTSLLVLIWSTLLSAHMILTNNEDYMIMVLAKLMTVTLNDMTYQWTCAWSCMWHHNWSHHWTQCVQSCTGLLRNCTWWYCTQSYFTNACTRSGTTPYNPSHCYGHGALHWYLNPSIHDGVYIWIDDWLYTLIHVWYHVKSSINAVHTCMVSSKSTSIFTIMI